MGCILLVCSSLWTRLKRAALYSLISFTIVASPLSVYAQMLPNESLFLKRNSPVASDHLSQLSPEELTEAKDILQIPTQHMIEIMYLLKKLHITTQKKRIEHGDDKFFQILDNPKATESISWEEAGIGKAELMRLGSIYLTKVRHNALRTTYLFVDQAQINLEELEKKPSSQLSKEQYNKELSYRRYLSKEWRRLYAQMIMAEWNPKYTYSEILFKKKMQQNIETNISPESAKEQTDMLLTEGNGHILEKQSFFQKLKRKTIDAGVIAQKDTSSDLHRDLVMITYNSQLDKVTDVSLQKKPSRLNYKYYQLYWQSIWEAPKYDQELWKREKHLGKLKVLLTGDYLSGIGLGLVFSSLAYAATALLPSSLPEGLTAFGVAKISFAWSLFFGVFAGTYKNFISRGSELSRFTKNWTTGLGQSYHFNFVADENLWLYNAEEKFDWNAAKTHTDILLNQTFKAAVKTPMQETTVYRNKQGLATGTVKFRDYKIILPWQHNPNIFIFEAEQHSVSTEALERLKYEDYSYIEPKIPGTNKTTKWWQMTMTDFWKQRVVPVLSNTFQKIDIKEEYRNLSEVLPTKNMPMDAAETNSRSYYDQMDFSAMQDLQDEYIPKQGLSLRQRAIRKVYGSLPEDTLIPRANLEGQMVQVVSTPVSLLSRFGLTVGGLPVGHMVYLALGPAGLYVALKYKQSYLKKLLEVDGATKNPAVLRVEAHVREEEKRWNDLRLSMFGYDLPYTNSIGFFVKILPKSLAGFSKKIAKWAVSQSAISAVKLTTGMSPVDYEKQSKLQNIRTTALKKAATEMTEAELLSRSYYDNADFSDYAKSAKTSDKACAAQFSK